MALLNKKSLKKEFEKNSLKIGNEAMNSFILRQEKIIDFEIEKSIRNAKINGRKVVRKEDVA